MKWVCSKCETLNEGSFCAICGEKAPEVPAAPAAAPATPAAQPSSVTASAADAYDADKTVAIFPGAEGHPSNPVHVSNPVTPGTPVPPYTGNPVPPMGTGAVPPPPPYPSGVGSVPPTGAYGPGAVPPNGAVPPMNSAGYYGGTTDTIAMMRIMEQKKKKNRTIAIVIAAVVGVIVLLAIIGSVGEDSANKENQSHGSVTVSTSAEPSSASSAKPSAKATYGGSVTVTPTPNPYGEVYTANTPAGEKAYMDIKSIEPAYGIGPSKTGGKEILYYNEVVCKCITTTGEKYYLYMYVTEFNKYIDPTADIQNVNKTYFDTVKLSPPKRVVGTAKDADLVSNGLKSKINSDTVLDFISINDIQ